MMPNCRVSEHLFSDTRFRFFEARPTPVSDGTNRGLRATTGGRADSGSEASERIGYLYLSQYIVAPAEGGTFP